MIDNNKYALLSVYDKDNILTLAQFFIKNNIKLISTGGTYEYLKAHNIPVIEISSITNFEEMLDGRVKTLHPHVHAGILAIRNNAQHMQKIQQHHIKLIDYVVVNLYPFFDKVNTDLSFAQKLEFIDIGGPTMLRAAAKNYQDVVVVCDKNDYGQLMNNISQNNVCLEFKRYLAAKVFNLMSAYDGAVANFMSQEPYPLYFTPSLVKVQSLRYGENPHQSASFYKSTTMNGAMNSFVTLNGKELSYNNYKDVDVAWKAVNEFDQPACCALKHNTPCGLAIGKTVNQAYTKAYKADPTSIFGGVVAFNRIVDVATAKALVKIFLEVIAAPGYDPAALKVLQVKKNLRVLKFTTKPQAKYSLVSVDGGVLVQSEDEKLYEHLNVVTKAKPTKKILADLLFAFKVVKYVRSNAIVVAKNGVTLGIGGGQVNRIWPTHDALHRGKGAVVLASDAFFPFDDVVKAAAKAKIKAIIQPGGAIRDQDSIKAADKYKMVMIFTGIRHFKH